MKKYLLLFIFILIGPFTVFSQSDSTGWDHKRVYVQQKYKIGAITFLRFSKDNKYLYTFGMDKTLRKWDVETGNIEREIQIDSVSVYGFDISADFKKVCYRVKNSTKEIRLYNIEDGTSDVIKIIGPYPFPNRTGVYEIKNYYIKFHPTLDQLIVFPTIKIYWQSLSKREFLGIVVGWFEAYSTDDGSFLYGCQPGSTKESFTFSHGARYSIYNTQSYEMKLDEYNNTVKRYTRKTILGSELCGIAKVIDEYVDSYSEPARFAPNNDVFSNDSKMLATSSWPNLEIMTIPNCKVIKKLKYSELGLNGKKAILFSNSNQNLIIGSGEEEGPNIKVWEIASPRLIRIFKFNGAITDWKFCYSHDTKKLATGSSDGVIRIFDSDAMESPKAYFTLDTTVVYQYDSLRFYDGSHGMPSKWQWDFGDGKTSTKQNPVHVYKEPGIYSISLIIGNGTVEDTITRKSFIKVKEKIDVNISENTTIAIEISPIPGNDYLKVSGEFDNTVSFEIISLDGSFVKSGMFAENNIINTSTLNPGVYFITIISGNKRTSKKFVLEK